jgi:cephalosporin-C deacetylase-like acetyl esterase/predicted Ser/Thr protein kinase
MSMIGKTLAHYEITSKLGEGGMGVVYLAHDTSLDRKVAIKLLPESLKRDETARKRFFREARSAAALDHPYICSIHEVGETEGKSFIVMEYLEGQTLRDRLAQGPIPLKEAMQWAAEVSEALAVAHEKGIIHRDLKPSNIMLQQSGHAKVMDFGLAKQLTLMPQSGSQEATLTGALTREGSTVGTIPYMSPEQVQGKTVDHRSDLFSFGIVLYEMLTGVNPFRRDSGFDTGNAILRETPNPIANYASDAPKSLTAPIFKLLAKKPEDRYPTAREVAADLRKAAEEALGQNITRPALAGILKAFRKPIYLVPLILILGVTAYFAVQGVKSYQKGKWAREVAPKEIEMLMRQDRPIAAAGLLKQAQRYAPESIDLDRLTSDLFGAVLTIQTTPPSADIYVRDYADTEGNDLQNWQLLGRSPLGVKPPVGCLRFRFVKEGFEPVEIAAGEMYGTIHFRLHPKDATHAGMLWVSKIAKRGAYPAVAPAEAAEFWIDKYEITNRQFKEFVDAGGYQKREYWKQPFVKEGKQVSWQQAMAAFRDPSGRPGPATWEFGTYPEGQADIPVGGVSWYEAAAYAEFAGKSLPTVYHWCRAGMGGPYADILKFSNFSGKGPSKAGTFRGLGNFGTYDMAGNMKEWCLNEVGDCRYIMGGAWNEPDYQFINPDARPPFDRAATFGFRCVQYTAPLPKALEEPVPASAFSSKDRRKDKPADDQAFLIYANLHSYDKADLKPVVESVDETSSPHWRKERITFQAAYGNERVIADLYIPRNAAPPYQVVLYFPGAGARVQKTLAGVDFRPISFILRSNRAMIVPHYKYTLERGPMPETRGRPDLAREIELQLSKDLGRSIDYLETRSEIDIDKLAYFGFSWGAAESPRLIAVEPRIKAAVLLLGGSGPKIPPEVDPWNFASRVKIPVLMINGRGDFIFPLETSQIPLFRLLGTPEKDKEHRIYDGGHDIVNRLDVFKDIMDWLDRYLGPVRMKPNR